MSDDFVTMGARFFLRRWVSESGTQNVLNILPTETWKIVRPTIFNLFHVSMKRCATDKIRYLNLANALNIDSKQIFDCFVFLFALDRRKNWWHIENSLQIAEISAWDAWSAWFRWTHCQWEAQSKWRAWRCSISSRESKLKIECSLVKTIFAMRTTGASRINCLHCRERSMSFALLCANGIGYCRLGVANGVIK